MSQIISTKYYGDLHFLKTWAQHNGVHVGLLVNGAYAHIGGLPVTDKNDLIAAIPQGEALKAALDWFENRHQRALDAVLAPPKLVMFFPPDQSWRYVDTNKPVENVEDLYEALKGSPAVEAALNWFFTTRKQAMAGAETNGANPRAGDGLDDRVFRLLGESEGSGMTLHDLGKEITVEPKALVDLLKSLEDDQIIARVNKRYYLPRYAPPGAVEDR